jgi:hypothetical protein
MEEKTPIGTLFNSINYYSNNDLDAFSNGMTNEQAIYCLNQAIKAAHSRGVFSLEESEVVSKALRYIMTNE